MSILLALQGAAVVTDQPKRSAALAAAILSTWIAAAPVAQPRRFSTLDSVDDPPVRSARTPWMDSAIWPSQRRPLFSQDSVDDPPPRSRPQVYWPPETPVRQRLITQPLDSVDDPPIRRAYQPLWPLDAPAIIRRTGNQVVSVDDPPLIGVSVPSRASARFSWEFPPQPTQGRKLTQETPAPVDDPPVMGAVRRLRHSIRFSWDKDPEPKQRFARKTEGTPFPTQFLGLKTYYGASVKDLCLVVEADGAVAMGGIPKIQKGGTKYAIFLVETTDPDASHVRIKTTTGIKAIRLFTSGAPTANALLDGSVHSDTLAVAVTRGAIVYGNSTPLWASLALGTKGKALLAGTSDISYDWPRRIPANHPLPYSSLFGNGAATNNGVLTSTNAGGTEADAAETGAASRIANKYTQALNGGVAGRQTTSSKIKSEMSPVFFADFKIAVVPTGAGSVMSFSAGFDTGLFGGNKAVRNQARFEWLQATDTNFRCLLGDGTTLNDMDSGIAQDTAWHDVLIYTTDNGTTWVFEIDGVQVQSSATNVPTKTTAMLAGVGFALTGANASNTPQVNNSYQHVWGVGTP